MKFWPKMSNAAAIKVETNPQITHEPGPTRITIPPVDSTTAETSKLANERAPKALPNWYKKIPEKRTPR
jgi:hypothetical protein